MSLWTYEFTHFERDCLVILHHLPLAAAWWPQDFNVSCLNYPSTAPRCSGNFEDLRRQACNSGLPILMQREPWVLGSYLFGLASR
ncbi:hypothetical protein BDI4_1010044 [Burkholderia diffusa]|nr:hypothetical protein BDI4_1010044 [Burkholderia diffusa]